MPHMALLVWDEVSWDGFVAGLEGFHDHFTPERAIAPMPTSSICRRILTTLRSSSAS